MSEASTFFEQTPTPPETEARFGDLHPALERQAAITEANRCLYCFDAPCMGACPTHIDVPRFIRKIATGNLAGSAQAILEANILGASCSRACPVEVLCEGSCVLHRYNKQPIEIALLQRFAMDAFHASGDRLPFVPAPATGKRVALIGAGPASLSCATELRKHGIAATISDARPLPGGLNSYGIAEYKLPLAESLREIDMIARLGVEFRFNTTVDAAMLAELDKTHDAIFIGAGLGAIHRLGIPGEDLPGVTNALDLVAGYKDGSIASVPDRVAVIGAGNTAIDAAIAARRLGAEEVYLVYRRGPQQMSAFSFEYDHARHEGVRFHWHKRVVAVEGTERVSSIRIAPTRLESDEPEFSVRVALLVLAIGQATHTGFLSAVNLAMESGRIVIDRATGKTSHPRYFAGGDCTNGGREVVDAVADGKRAGLAIAASLLEGKHAHA
jgi:dihydropyrimidine dehydrogenase (NAD+) subunit PreT